MGQPCRLPAPTAATHLGCPERHAAFPAPKSLDRLCGDTQSKAKAGWENTQCRGRWAEPVRLPFGQQRAHMEKHLPQTPWTNSLFLSTAAGFLPPHPSPPGPVASSFFSSASLFIIPLQQDALYCLSLQLASVNPFESSSTVAKKYSNILGYQTVTNLFVNGHCFGLHLL